VTATLIWAAKSMVQKQPIWKKLRKQLLRQRQKRQQQLLQQTLRSKLLSPNETAVRRGFFIPD
jgi:hypothetical protein